MARVLVVNHTSSGMQPLIDELIDRRHHVMELYRLEDVVEQLETGVFDVVVAGTHLQPAATGDSGQFVEFDDATAGVTLMPHVVKIDEVLEQSAPGADIVSPEAVQAIADAVDLALA